MIADLNQLVAKCQIFISYKRSTGEELAYLLYEKLTASGYHVFFDSKGLIDENYKKAIEKKIQECTDFIVLLTAHSMDGLIDEKEEDINTEKEDWLAKEIRMAIKNNKHIFDNNYNHLMSRVCRMILHSKPKSVPLLFRKIKQVA